MIYITKYIYSLGMYIQVNKVFYSTKKKKKVDKV